MAIAVDGLAVALHIQLLQIVGQRAQIVVVDQRHLTGGAEKVDVPHPERGQDHRQILFQRRGAEVFVHRVRAVEQLREMLHAQIHHDRQTDGRPQRIAPADPVPELEHVGGIDAELGHALGVGRHRDKMLGHRPLITQFLNQPSPGSMGIGHGLLGGEGLGGDDKQGALGIALGQDVADMRAVHVGDEMHPQGRIAIRLQRLADHLRPQIGTADADVDHVADALAGLAAPLAAPDLFGELAHVLQHVVHARHHVLAVDEDRPVAPIAQGDVQHGTAFGVVDHLAGEHPLDPGRRLRLASQFSQQAEGLSGDAVLGKIHQQIAEASGECGETLGIGGEQVAQVQVGDDGMMGFQLLPDRQVAGSGHGQLPLWRLLKG